MIVRSRCAKRASAGREARSVCGDVFLRAVKGLAARGLTEVEHLTDLGVAVVEHLMQQKHGSLSRIQALE